VARPSLALDLTQCQGRHTATNMPTYEYACSACGNEWEQTQRITEAPIDVCPACGKSTAHRLISRGTNFILKGGGWYSDLYSSPKPADAAKPTTEGAEKKSEGDNKPAPAAGASPEKTAKTASPPAKPAAADGAAPSSSSTSGTSPGTSSAPTS
jgi:putative FmdB family regulatory protein